MRVDGEVTVPGDKSISHRALILGALAKGRTYIGNALAGGGCSRDDELPARLRRVGARLSAGRVRARRRRVASACAARTAVLDCGNSGTTMRLLAGVLAGSDVRGNARRRRLAAPPPDAARGRAAARHGREVERVAGRDRAAPRPRQARRSRD